MQSDLFGDKPARKFKDIRKTRDGVAEQKAVLCEQIRLLCAKIPAKVINGDVIAVRGWKKVREETLVIASSSRSSVHELTAALSNMERVCK